MSKVVSIAARVAESQAAENFRFSDKTHRLGIEYVQSDIETKEQATLFVDGLWADGCRARYLKAGELFNQGMALDVKRIMVEGRKALVTMPFTVKKGRKKAVENRDIEAAQAWEALRDMGIEGRKTHPKVTVTGKVKDAGLMDAETAYNKLSDIARNGFLRVLKLLQDKENQESGLPGSTGSTGKSDKGGSDKGGSASSGKKARTTGVPLVLKDLDTVGKHLKAAKSDIPNYSDIQKALKALIAMLPQG